MSNKFETGIIDSEFYDIPDATKSIIELTQNLISCITIEGGCEKEFKRAFSLIEQELKSFHIFEFENNGYKSILVSNKKQIPKKFKLIINGHIDVIPSTELSDYQPYISDNKIIGCGASDMKGGLASAIIAFKHVAKIVDYPVCMQIVSDEEVGGFYGTKYQLGEGIIGDFILSTEPTNLDIVNKAKGGLHLNISFTGKSYHGAYTWKGNNAILQAIDFINQIIELYPVPNKPTEGITVNVAKVSTTNESYNKIPDNANVLLDVRFPHGEKNKIYEKIQKISRNYNASISIFAEGPSLYTTPDNPYIQLIQSITNEITQKTPRLYQANGSSDARHYSELGYNGIEFGPVSGGIGSGKEWVDINSLHDYYKIICQMILNTN